MFEISTLSQRKLLTILSVAVSFGWATNGNAQDAKWDFTGYLYLWGPALSGETTTGGSIDISFSDILDNLDFALMGAVEARRGRFSIFADALYLDLSDDEGAAVGPGIPASADADVRGNSIFPALLAMILLTTPARGSLFWVGFGAWISTPVLTFPLLLDHSASLGGSTTGDAIIGLRGTTQIADRWGFSYYTDIGAGESDLTAQLSAAVNYRINNWDLVFGYRYLTWDLGNSQGAV